LALRWLFLLSRRWHSRFVAALAFAFCRCAGIRVLLPLFDALPLCGAAPTFLCRLQRKVGKRKQLQTTRLTNIFSV